MARPALLRDNANELFEVLFDTAKRQQEQIAALQAALHDKVTASTVAELAQNITQKQEDAAKAILNLEREVEVKGAETLPVGVATVANRAALESIAVEVSKRAIEQDVYERLQRLDRQLNEKSLELKEWGASSSTAAALEQSCTALAQRCAGLEQRLERCLNRDEAEILIAAAERLRNFDQFVKRTDEGIQRLGEICNLQESAIDTLQNENDNLRQMLSEVRATLDRKADTAAIKELSAELRQIDAVTQRLTPMVQHENLLEETMRVKKGLLRLKDGLQKTIETMHLQGVAIHKIEDDKASRVEVDEYAAGLRQSIAVVQSALQRAVGERCTVKKAEQIRADMEEVAEKLARTEKMAQLGLKFVEWFSTRGQAYEHNMGALDRHLRKLVLSSARPGTKGCGSVEDKALESQLEPRFEPFAGPLHDEPFLSGTNFTNL